MMNGGMIWFTFQWVTEVPTSSLPLMSAQLGWFCFGAAATRGWAGPNCGPVTAWRDDHGTSGWERGFQIQLPYVEVILGHLWKECGPSQALLQVVQTMPGGHCCEAISLVDRRRTIMDYLVHVVHRISYSEPSCFFHGS